ncbi:MAG: 4-hydroxy-3-methylbut-2-enyl diphosphate reductase [Lactobacillales bacterium]|jgi:4-hydroxy-3-methylbut-2-enyl diphosphate reductase|nr:4-hydroxy-3-methylbut-2-enyl diphosphate reductase [Lactobacillales bacterium]
MIVKNITPRGYCRGVVDAFVIAKNATLDTSLPRPIYILGMIVHNEHVTKALDSIGIITLDGENRLSILDQIDSGTVIFTAHGVSPEVRKKASEKGLTVVDATCPDVMITHELIAEKAKSGISIIYIGKAGHPETEGAIGVANKNVYLVSSINDVDKLPLDKNTPIFITNQTTMSQWDVENIINHILEIFPNAIVHKDICNATQIRQNAVAEQAKDVDLLIVVGDPRSNNTNRLAQVGEEQAGTKSYRIADVSEIDPAWFDGVKTVALTAGASTPTQIVKEVENYLVDFDPNRERISHVSSEDILPLGNPNIEEKRKKRLEKLRCGSS